MTTYKRCTSCKREKRITKFRKRKTKGKRPSDDIRIATCDDCERKKCPDSHWQRPPPPKPRVPFEADPTDPDVIRFRKEMERRGA